MLDKYREGQPVAYDVLKNSIENNAIGHAYLFYSDSDKIALDFALCFAKTLLCPQNCCNNNKCGSCSICHRIDNNNFPELKIIEPDGLWIKKDQLIDLQENFRMMPLEGDKKIYIINGVNKLNNNAANSILKFLEEPEPNIIALLTTSDMHNVLPTIISRCQLISLKGYNDSDDKISTFDTISNKSIIEIGKIYNKDEDELKVFVEDAKNVAKLDAIVLFIKKYEVSKLDVLLDIKKQWNSQFTEKNDYTWAFDIMTLFYKDVLNFMYSRKLDIFDYYNEIIEMVAPLNKVDDIIRKLKKIILIKEKVKYNMNLNLLMDKLIIEMERGR